MAKKAEPKKAGPKTADVPAKIIEAAMKLAAEEGWRDLSLARIAEAAKLPLSKVYPEFPSKQAILDAFSRRVDVRVLVEEAADAREGGARDRLSESLKKLAIQVLYLFSYINMLNGGGAGSLLRTSLS